MDHNKSLPTYYYPFVERNNWRYWYKLRNGEFIVKDFQTFNQCLKMLSHCRKLNIEYKAVPRQNFLIGTRFAFLLNLFYNRITDRNRLSQKNPENFQS